ncbi:MAG: hypothetical protein QXO49_02425, partial [Candidatus Bathyarchaeia archaeon]
NGVNIKRIFIPILKADFADLNGYHEISDKNIALEMTTSMGAYVKLNVAVDYAGDVTVIHLERGRKFAIVIFDNLPENTSIKFAFNLPKLVNIGSDQVQYFEAYELIKQMRINYIMIDKNRRREFKWFNNDENHFSKEFENEIIAIFVFKT